MRVILGSRSPRRRQLLSRIVDEERIEVIPPTDASEPGFDGLAAWSDIDTRLLETARGKCHDVVQSVRATGNDGSDADSIVITADTVIVAEDGDGRLRVLGQPPGDDWEAAVREWFREHLSGRTHTAATAVSIATDLSNSAQPARELIVKTQVTFADVSDELVEWYVRTGEPRGKAGGYAIQAAGSMFVNRVEGSISNVVGLPLGELWNELRAIGVVG